MPNLTNSLYARWWRIIQMAKIPGYQEALLTLRGMYASELTVFIFPPGLGWTSHLHQRPQQLAQALARQGSLVFYIEPEESKGWSGFSSIGDLLYLCHVPLQTFKVLDKPYIYSLSWNYPYAKTLAQNGGCLIYDWVDDLAVFGKRESRIKSQHAELLKSSAVVLTTAECLHQMAVKERPDAHLCPNGVDYEHFSHLTQTPAPEDIKPILAEGKPLIGYHGALARWFDYDLLIKVAIMRPDLTFILIGPDHDHTIPLSLLQQVNIRWLGAKPYHELPGYVKAFDVGMIPFLINNMTHATSPIKLFEYMAAGKPVVSSPIRECMRYEEVLIADGPREFATSLDIALKTRGDPGFISQCDRLARENTWDMRGKQIMTALHSTLIKQHNSTGSRHNEQPVSQV